ncbi:restriction endonuclease [Pseudodesulfovibrio sp. F-1]|uniref:Restriction endonuclease n=1 Tax=Pseudodesulfovibrio alkaliphilus TaxID=2661613 RepID=A0A7K1KMC5_9BACT|nr:restriction endonuclease [Pseudodesulfovibrio alkaliphilus]MUM77243.1 restriction endonuclease [Pseudodesulfovibrio alkaliphilus]
MTRQEFEALLNTICGELTAAAREMLFETAASFEDAVRLGIRKALTDSSIKIDFKPHPQAFPDIAVGNYGVEVKFTLNDTWRSVANSVLETNRIETVKQVYLVFGKMGGLPEVRWAEYEQSVIHVRTSHVPRFEVELFARRSLFELMGIGYDAFRSLPMEEKMRHIRAYARSRLKSGERLWWLEDSPEAEHALPIQARLYTSLSSEEKIRLRAEAALLCPGIVKSGRSRNKYDDVVLYLLTYHGVVCHQARDLFSAGSVANPLNDDEGGIYIERALKLVEDEMRKAALMMDDALFVEYWGESVPPDKRISRWLTKADAIARDWVPSKSLFLPE